MTLNGIDVSANQSADITSKVSCDFAIVKASGNPNRNGYRYSYVNPLFEKQINGAIDTGKLIGAYHFLYGMEDYQREMNVFLDRVKDYIGRAILVLDYEETALKLGKDYLHRCFSYIQERTAVTPFIYASSSVINEQKLYTITDNIWSANYWRGYDRVYGFDTSSVKNGYPGAKIWQFTSTGYIGKIGALDLNVAYMTRKEWTDSATSMYSNIPDTPLYTGDINKMVSATLAGSYGNGNERRAALGPDYGLVQCIVNKYLGYPLGKSNIEEAAKQTIAGRYGNGETRKETMTFKGITVYPEIQHRVNELLK